MIQAYFYYSLMGSRSFGSLPLLKHIHKSNDKYSMHVHHRCFLLRSLSDFFCCSCKGITVIHMRCRLWSLTRWLVIIHIYMKCKCNFTISIIYLIYILYNHVLGFIFFNAISRYQTTAEKRFTMRQVSCYEALKLFIMMSCMNGIAHAAFITCIMC